MSAEWWMLGVSTASAITAIVAVCFAARSSGQAERANDLAEGSAEEASKANSLAREANESAQRANAIAQEALELQQLHSPPAWSELEMDGKSNYRIKNTSGRTIELVEFRVEPAEADGLVRRHTELPREIEYGDSYSALILRTFQLYAETAVLSWRYADEPDSEPQTTIRRVP